MQHFLDMMHLNPTESNLSLLALNQHSGVLHQVFSKYDKVDFTIDCVLEGSMCEVFADDSRHPQVFLIKNGPFFILGGDAKHPSANLLLEKIPNGSTVLPSPPDWIYHLEQHSIISLTRYQRYSLSHEGISLKQLEEFNRLKCSEIEITQIDSKSAHEIMLNESFNYHFQNFNSVSDFLERGKGFVALNRGEVIGVASSALVCSKGIEINIMVMPKYRGRLIGKRLAAKLVYTILKQKMIPHWDAANDISLKLARQIGYQYTNSYTAYKVNRIS